MRSADICRQTVFLQSAGRVDIRYNQDMPPQACLAECDARQLGQALTNLLKNAAEAIDARPAPLVGTLFPGEIRIRLAPDSPDRITLSVEDNGKGLPVEERNSLTEPYVTTRSKGTGLGLAIVKKIMEDHHGELALADRPGGGAIVSLIWPRHQPKMMLCRIGRRILIVIMMRLRRFPPTARRAPDVTGGQVDLWFHP